MIEARGLAKNYRGVPAVADVSFVVPSASVTGLIGLNGAGKSSVIRMILGLCAPTDGVALVNGHPFVHERHAAREVGAVFENQKYPAGWTGVDCLVATASRANLAKSRVGDMMEFIGLDEKIGRRRVATYSLGMRQRLAIGRAMLADPRVLILDEPTNGLDPAGIAWLRDVLAMLSTRGCTILLSSHLLSEVERLADNVVVMHKGRVVFDGSPSEVIGTNDSLETLLLGLPAEFGVAGD